MKKALIYDSSKGFSSFIKRNYSEKLELDICNNKFNLKNYNSSNYQICFFMVNDIEDYFLLKKYYFEIEYFFIISYKTTLLEKIKKLEYTNAVLIDSDHSKKYILDLVNFLITIK
jgi:hypothetical protein